LKTPDYILPLEIEFKKYADPTNAVQMKKYMKDRSEFFGIKSPPRRELYRKHISQFGLMPVDQREKIVKWCWEAPQREWQYFAMEFLGKEAKKVNENIIDLYEFMIVTKSWWDSIDYISANLVGPYLQKFPEHIPHLMTRWMNSDNMWLQRTCLLFQLKYKTSTDTQLLSSFIKPLSSSNEFFIRKAIGWALREYSKTDPDFVIQFVKENTLSGLSEREALKWLRNKGLSLA
jgi:3-methyladenine DNA glycosylase AlkD